MRAEKDEVIMRTTFKHKTGIPAAILGLQGAPLLDDLSWQSMVSSHRKLGT